MKKSSKELEQEYENLLNPNYLKPRLIYASLFITNYELLKSCIVKRIKDFFTNDFDENGWIIDPKYKKSLEETGKTGHLEQSLAWLHNMKTITDEDIACVHELRKYRNQLVHELPEMISKFNILHEAQLMAKAITLLRKIEIWWIQNVELATDPDYDGEEIKDEDINPGTVMFMQMVADITLSEGEEAEKYMKEFSKLNSK